MNWQPIETAPRGVAVLVCGLDFCGDVVVTGAKRNVRGDFFIIGVGEYGCEIEIHPTHWAPAPAGPVRRDPPCAAGKHEAMRRDGWKGCLHCGVELNDVAGAVVAPVANRDGKDGG